MTLYTGGGRNEDAILAAIYRGSPADHAYLASTSARWYDPPTHRWSSDWRAYAMSKKKPVPAAQATRTAKPSEQRALDKKKALGKADPVKDKTYPPPAKKQAQTKEKDKPKTPPQPPVSLDAVPDIADCLPDLVEEYRQLSAEEAVIKARKEEIAPEVLALLEAVGQRSVFTDEWAVRRQTNVNVSISREKLLAAGVDMDTIEEATERKETKPFIQVTLRNEGKS